MGHTMFIRLSRRWLTTVVTPGQGIITQESLLFYKQYFQKDSKIKQLVNQAKEITHLPFETIFQSPTIDLQLTSVQQPLIVLLNTIQQHILKEHFELDLEADYCIGHSIGEITNLSLQKCISFEDAIDISHKRGLLMEKVIQNTGIHDYKMFALVIERGKIDLVIPLLRHCPGVSISNINSDEQIVISGESQNCLALIEQVSKICKLRKSVDLKVYIPFHSDTLEPVINDLKSIFQTTEKLHSTLPIESILNLDGSPTRSTDEYINKILQCTSKTVNFKKCIDFLIGTGEKLTFINYSPVTKSLVDRYLKSQKINYQSYCLNTDENINSLISSK